MKFFHFFLFFCGPFLPSWIQIRIHIPYADQYPAHETKSGFGSTTLIVPHSYHYRMYRFVWFLPEINVLYLFLLTFLEATGTVFQIYEMLHTGENLSSVKNLLIFQAYKRFKSECRTGKTFLWYFEIHWLHQIIHWALLKCYLGRVTSIRRRNASILLGLSQPA